MAMLETAFTLMPQVAPRARVARAARRPSAGAVERRFFSGARRIVGVHHRPAAEVLARFPEAGQLDLWVGALTGPVGYLAADAPVDAWLPAEREVLYNTDGSRHLCCSACLHARGAECECSCGGANHGKLRGL